MELLTCIILDINSYSFLLYICVVKNKSWCLLRKGHSLLFYAHSQDTVPCIPAHPNLEKLNLKLIGFQHFLWSVNSVLELVLASHATNTFQCKSHMITAHFFCFHFPLQIFLFSYLYQIAVPYYFSLFCFTFSIFNDLINYINVKIILPYILRRFVIHVSDG